MTTQLENLGISSPNEAAELELDLGVRFDDFTPQDSDTWNRQTLYLNQYARTRTFTHAARAAGVSIRTRPDMADRQHPRLQPTPRNSRPRIHRGNRGHPPRAGPTAQTLSCPPRNAPPSAPARKIRSRPPRQHARGTIVMTTTTTPSRKHTQEDRDSLEDIRRDIQDLKLFAGLTDPDPHLVPRRGRDTERGSVYPSPTKSPIDADSNPAPCSITNTRRGEVSNLPQISPPPGERHREGA